VYKRQAYDIYFRERPNRSRDVYRVLLSKFALLLVALAAAYVAAQKPAGILVLVAMSFSLAASAFFPPMVMGIYWRGTTRAGALAGMAAGLAVCLFYIVLHAPWVSNALGLSRPDLWFGIKPVSAGVFGAPAGAFVTWVVSLLTRRSVDESPVHQPS
jgi:cation/acetate symporter